MGFVKDKINENIASLAPSRGTVSMVTCSLIYLAPHHMIYMDTPAIEKGATNSYVLCLLRILHNTTIHMAILRPQVICRHGFVKQEIERRYVSSSLLGIRPSVLRTGLSRFVLIFILIRSII